MTCEQFAELITSIKHEQDDIKREYLLAKINDDLDYLEILCNLISYETLDRLEQAGLQSVFLYKKD